MSNVTDETNDRAGTFKSGRLNWNYAECDGVFDVWNVEDVTVADLALAARRLHTLHGVEPEAVRVRMLPTSGDVLGDVQGEFEVRDPYDAALQGALRLLGVEDGGRGMCSYGMPSEYRGWLGYARLKAEEFRRRTAGEESALWYLADEVMIGTGAVALSMRFGDDVLPYLTAIALAGLRRRLKDAEAIGVRPSDSVGR